jgi:type II secretory pathway pseudopilin PulG
MMKGIKGFSLIELTMFIVIMGFLSVVILASLNISSERAPELTRTTQAAFLAQRRMEILLANYRYLVETQTTIAPTPNTQGFNAFTTDPCTTTFPAALCTFAGYTVTGSVGAAAGDLRTLTVTVVGTDINFNVTTRVSNTP